MQFFPRSLRLRVVANVFATSFLIILLIYGLIFSQFRVVTDTVSRNDLLEQAKRIASYIEYNWLGNFELDMPKRFRDYYAQGSTHQFAVLDSGGRVLFRSHNFSYERVRDTLDKSGKHYFNLETETGKRLVGLKYDYLFEDKIYPIYVIEDEAEFSRFITTLEKDFLTNTLLYGSPLLVLQALLILFIFRETFKPIIKASRDARNIKYDNLSYRLDEYNVHTEIKPLIQSLNNGLARLEKSAEAQKFFIANAAHELRTPISILKARIASLKNEKEVYMLNEDLRNINRLIGQMLDISRLDVAEAAPKTQISLNEIAKRACEDMGPLFIQQGKELSLEELKADQLIQGNEDMLFRAVLNLLENALKHTPEKTSVEVMIDEQKIIVRDYGTPIPDEHKIKIFEKFEKMPESAARQGSGLGLAIVKRAAEIHGGAVSLVVRENGNDFILDFS